MKNELKHTVISLVASIALAAGCGNESESGARGTSASADPGAQRVAVTVTSSGYEPDEVQAEAGKPLTLVFTRTSDQGCGHEVAIPSAGIERELPLNQPVEVTFTPEAAGEVRFTCGMDMYDGKIVVR